LTLCSVIRIWVFSRLYTVTRKLSNFVDFVAPLHCFESQWHLGRERDDMLGVLNGIAASWAFAVVLVSSPFSLFPTCAVARECLVSHRLNPMGLAPGCSYAIPGDTVNPLLWDLGALPSMLGSEES
jgi:hypothetical protein